MTYDIIIVPKKKGFIYWKKKSDNMLLSIYVIKDWTVKMITYLQPIPYFINRVAMGEQNFLTFLQPLHSRGGIIVSYRIVLFCFPRRVKSTPVFWLRTVSGDNKSDSEQ